jgi:hypothetical protein
MKDSVTGLDIPDTGFFEYGTVVGVRYLRQRLPLDIVVASQVPNPRPARLVTVRGAPTGRSTMNMVLAMRRLIIDCYDTTEAQACRTAEMVRGYMIDGMYRAGSGFRDVTVVGEPYYWPDPSDPSATPRAQMTVDILIRSRQIGS